MPVISTILKVSAVRKGAINSKRPDPEEKLDSVKCIGTAAKSQPETPFPL